MNQATLLIEAIRAEADEVAPKLIYADWLSRQPSSACLAQAEFIRLQCSPATQRNPKLATLLRQYGATWIPAGLQLFPQQLPGHQNNVHLTEFSRRSRRYDSQQLVQWRDGFLQGARLDRPDDVVLGGLEQLPLFRHLTAWFRDTEDCRFLERLPALSQLILAVDPTVLPWGTRLRFLVVGTAVEKLALFGSVSRAGYHYLAQLSSLTDLRVSRIEPEIRFLPRLRCLIANSLSPELPWGDLAELCSLETLRLPGTTISAEALAHLASWESLEQLALPHATSHWPGIVAEEFTLIPPSWWYGQLDRVLTPPTLLQAGGGQWAQLRSVSLKRLGVRVSGLADSHLAMLAGLTNLRRLNLTQNAVTDEGLRHLCGLTLLQELQLEGTRVTTLQPLRGHPNLRRVNLSTTLVNDRCVDVLLSWPQLQEVAFGNSAVSPAARKRVKAYCHANGG